MSPIANMFAGRRLRGLMEQLVQETTAPVQLGWRNQRTPHLVVGRDGNQHSVVWSGRGAFTVFSPWPRGLTSCQRVKVCMSRDEAVVELIRLAEKPRP
jgi:hypothetical protein